MRLKDTNEIFTDDLRDPTYAAGYLNISLEDDGIEGFLYALQKVARAHGVSKVAESSGMPRESLYRALSDKGNPGVRPLARVLGSLGLCLTVAPSGPESCLDDEEEVADTVGASDPPILQVDAPMPQEQSQTTREIATLQHTIAQEFAMLRDMAQQLAATQEEARKERLEARQVTMALQEEVRCSQDYLQQLMEVIEDQGNRSATQKERTTLGGLEPDATYSFPFRTGKRRIDEKMYQSNPLKLVKGAA